MYVKYYKFGDHEMCVSGISEFVDMFYDDIVSGDISDFEITNSLYPYDRINNVEFLSDCVKYINLNKQIKELENKYY